MVDSNLWIHSRSGNPTIRTIPYEGDSIEYLGDYLGWYRCFKLEHDIIAISEPGHAQGVFAYMIFGKNKVMLLDTGMGITSIKPVVDRLMPPDKELIVVNTHTHFDHIGSNYEFDKVYIYNHVDGTDRAEKGYPHEEILPEITPEQFFFPYPDDYSPDEFIIQPFEYRLMNEGDVFDLGDRHLEVIYTPGHSKDGIMLYDTENKLIFTGDTYYPGRLFLLISRNQIAEYISTLDKIMPYVKKSDRLIPSHNCPQDDPAIIDTVRNAIIAMYTGNGPVGRWVKDLGDNLMAYDFNGCTIVLPVD